VKVGREVKPDAEEDATLPPLLEEEEEEDAAAAPEPLSLLVIQCGRHWQAKDS
jgi:hypothetical protein